jgi:hypothetical protein
LSSGSEKKDLSAASGRVLFFLSPSGEQVDPRNLRSRDWVSALKEVGLAQHQAMQKTRDSFAAIALSFGESLCEYPK